MNTRFFIQALFAFLGPCQIVMAATEEEIVEAFKNDALVQEEMRNVRAATGGKREEVQVVPLGSACGVVGCHFRSLVVMRITTEGTNPHTGTVLATVEGMNGKIEKVELVEIAPKQANPTSRKDGVDLRVLEREPLPPPKLEIERKEP